MLVVIGHERDVLGDVSFGMDGLEADISKEVFIMVLFVMLFVVGQADEAWGAIKAVLNRLEEMVSET